MVKQEQEITKLYPVKSGAPQDSELGSIPPLDCATSKNIMTPSLADEKAIILNILDSNISTIHLQQPLNDIQEWSRLWRIKLNEHKSVK